ncbi:MAG: hypothetical protein U0V74_03775 [Chitinophagales bacterium]
MIKKFFSFLALLGAFAGLSAQDMQSNWAPKPVTLDGSAGEWPQPFRYYDGVTHLQFAVANDTANLYVCLLVNDEATQHRIFRGGLNMWFDAKGKKKETVGLTYPLKGNHTKPGAPEEQESQSEQQQNPWVQNKGINKLKERELAHQNMLVTHGMAGIDGDAISIKNTYGIQASLGWDSLGIMCLEYQIPLSRILNRSMVPADTTLAVQFGLVEPAIEGIGKKDNKDDENNDRYSNMTMPNSGMGSFNNNLGSQGLYNNTGYNNNGLNNPGYGGYNNGSYAAMAPPSQSGINPLSQDAKCWSKLKLAYNK